MFFSLAMTSPGRQHAFRRLVIAHALIAAIAVLALRGRGDSASILGNVLLVLGIVEGALVIGWRLTQLPKSQALEFLLVSPLRPPRVLLAEALVGVARLALVTLSGLPVLLLLVLDGVFIPGDLLPLVLAPLVWGSVTGLALTTWAYEPLGVRRWGERLIFGLVLLYLLVGVLAGENLRAWLTFLPGSCGDSLVGMFAAWHVYNPFGVMKFYFENSPVFAWPAFLTVQFIGIGCACVLLTRSACRLAGHFHDRHYRPVIDTSGRKRAPIGDRPLSWWAVKRVTEYSGRVNLWLAAGFGVLYAAYTVAGDDWPAWMGRAVFVVFDRAGGIPMLATALVLLAAVPAAFQYGLWDSSVQERCRRLELLLLTRLDAHDYWHAAAAAAWRRGRGYFAVAVILLAAGVAGGKLTPSQAVVSLAAGVILWGVYFALGFRAFSRGLQANALGLGLTVGLPLLAVWLYQSWPLLASLVPPGSVVWPSAAHSCISWLPGPALGALTALGLSHFTMARAEDDLRRWYAQNHGRKE